MSNFKIPLMEDNITKEDVNNLISFLNQNSIPKLTNGPKVVEFENYVRNKNHFLFPIALKSITR